ncbi:MAG TPA: hypothetical protein VGL64_14620 [Amycolatopsis sp.]
MTGHWHQPLRHIRGADLTGEPAVVVIARSSQEDVVVNLPGLWAPVDAPEE